MLNFFGYNLPLKKQIFISLTKIYGIGISTSKKLCNLCNINFYKKLFELKNIDISCLKNNINKYIIGNNLKKIEKLNIRKLINIKCYRGIRHYKNLPSRGQKTRNNSKTRKKLKIYF